MQPLPLVTGDAIAEALRIVLRGYKSCTGVEVFVEFPSDMEKARHGIYISDVATIERVPYQLAVRYGGNIYTVSDSFTIIYITFQGDGLKDTVTQAIQSLVYDNVLFDGYHERDYTVDDEFKNRAEYKTFDFVIKRIDFQ